MMTTIYLVRHAESEGNTGIIIDLEARKLGLGSPLSPEGKEQAKRLQQKLSGISFNAAYSSPLLRAKQTAEILLNNKNLTISDEPDIEEIRVGNHHTDDIYEKYNALIDKLDKLPDEEKFRYKLFDDMESAEEVALRMKETLLTLSQRHTDQTLLLVSHGQIMRSFLVLMGYGTYSELPTNSLENTGYIILETDGKGINLQEVHGVKKNSSLSFPT